jgi:hypothetical protein
VLLASTASTQAEYSAAEDSIRRAHSLNPEETGTLLLLGEIGLLRGDLKLAGRCFHDATQANPRSVGGLFLGSYVAWKGRDEAGTANLLASARKAAGPEWKPKGSVAEGDVQRRMDRHAGLLAPFWQEWSGAVQPETAFSRLDRYLRSRLPATGAARQKLGSFSLARRVYLGPMLPA